MRSLRNFLGAFLVVHAIVLVTDAKAANKTTKERYQINQNFSSTPKHDIALGSHNASKTIILFQMFNCPGCRKLNNEVLPEVLHDEKLKQKNVRILYRFFPTTVVETSFAMLIHCAWKTGNLKNAGDVMRAQSNSDKILLDASNSTGLIKVKKLADALGLDQDTTDRCLGDQSLLDHIRNEANAAADSHREKFDDYYYGLPSDRGPRSSYSPILPPAWILAECRQSHCEGREILGLATVLWEVLN